MREMLISIPDIWKYMNILVPEKKAIYDEHLCDSVVDLTYHQVYDAVHRAAGAFQALGIKRGDHVAVFGENSAHWLFADQGVMLLGGATVVRGADAPIEELRYIYDNADAREVVVLQGPTLLKKMAKAAERDCLEGIGLSNKHGPARTAVLMHREGLDDVAITSLASSLGVRVLCLADIMNSSKPIQDSVLPNLTSDTLATIVYTSGTTGRPKGVMLSHGNLLHQITLRFAPSKPYDKSEPLPDDVMVTMLPVWHITERAAELCIFSRGCKLVYSSVKHLKADLAIHKPHWMMLVPRVLEKISLGVQEKFAKKSKLARVMIHFFTMIAAAKNEHLKIAKGQVIGKKKPNLLRRLFARCIATLLTPLDLLGTALVWGKVKQALGGRQKLIVSGGSALSGKIEDFFSNIGVLLIVGYGLTECSPLLCHRRSDRNLIAGGCVGYPLTKTEVRVVDPDAIVQDVERDPIEHGVTGLVLARGPQIMKGYYKNQKATEKAIDKFGWFNTEDLGYINPATGDLFINGRAKDTIVLSNGENIEPQPIEDAILSSSLVEQVMLSGQDEKRLSAIVVVNPDALAKVGLLDKDRAASVMKDYETVNDPKCTEEDCFEACKRLEEASTEIRSKELITERVKSDVKKATAAFRKWEQVNNVFITLEPFAMGNGLLTQSYKVKRDAVAKRYENELHEK
ncbi:hypothetical protein ACHAXM_001094 [Skeletonema potamos]